MTNHIRGRDSASLHHKIGQCHKSEFNIWEKENKVIISQKFHDAFNMVFGDKQTPKEQLLAILQFTEDTLSEETKEGLYEILSRTDRRFYLRKLVK